jgi:hypothetical protein
MTSNTSFQPSSDILKSHGQALIPPLLLLNTVSFFQIQHDTKSGLDAVGKSNRAEQLVLGSNEHPPFTWSQVR